jgi:hypothetical protein
MTKTIGTKRPASKAFNIYGKIRKLKSPEKPKGKSTNRSTVTNIHRLNTHYTAIKLPKTVFDNLKIIYTKSSSSNKRVEYAGKVSLNAYNGLVKVTTNSPGTSGLRGGITAENVKKYMHGYVSFHTHPSAVPKNSRRVNNRGVKFFTIPSMEDLLLYTASYPNMQANLVLDEHGYYIIDIIEGVKINRRPNMNIVRDIYNKFHNDMLSKNMLAVFEGKYIYYMASRVDEWKEIFNKFSHKMKTFTGLSMNFYTWKERGTITISNKNIR